MNHPLLFLDIRPTVFLRQGARGLEQCVRVTLNNEGSEGAPGALVADALSGTREFLLDAVPPGESCREIFLDAPDAPCEVTFALKQGGCVCDTRCVPWTPPRRWVVHVVQLSHHDVGYTNLASNVLRESDGFLDQVIDMAAATRAYPDEAQFRMVVEQAWSIDRFLRHAPAERVAAMVALMRSGHVELTALFGNLASELCGHETLVRAAYHAFRLKRRYGIPIVSAEHNDIPGFSWGLSTVLTEAGIRLFCPGLPQYYSWCEPKLPSFWDQQAVFGHDGPGAFWWEAPSGKRVLFWCNNSGCGGDCHAGLPTLAARLDALASGDYPYRVIRWPVQGGARDNSPYIEGYAHTIRKWNATWAYPRLISSTNARFLDDFVGELDRTGRALPVHRGELPGQDYPTGAMSTAAPTSVNRNNHAAVPTAERWAALASAVTDAPYPAEEIDVAYEETLWHDEHTWGHHFPAGPTSRAAECEKAVHAYRAAALAYDASSKALARMADRVRLDAKGLHLVVFNALPYARAGVVRTPLREIPNCGSTMYAVPPEDDECGEGFLRAVLLHDRWHVNPPLDCVKGKFDLVDTATGEAAPFQIVPIDAPDATVPFAAQRLGLGSGRERYGFMETPTGIKRDLVFIARDVPACGYRTYRLVPRDVAPGHVRSGLQCDENRIENAYYRVVFDPDAGHLSSLYDKEAGRELLDAAAPHAFGAIVARTPESDTTWSLTGVRATAGAYGNVSATLEWTGALHGHPAVRESLTLYAGLKRIEFAVAVLKDPTPLLDVHLAFPFAVAAPRFRYEGGLSVMSPIVDYLPGAYSDAVPVQQWVAVNGGGASVLWASLDSPSVSLGDLWPGYVSPAHSCLLSPRTPHPPLTSEDLRHGWIYSTLFANNFGTNFAVSQSGAFLFRYVITTHPGDADDGRAAQFGFEAAVPLQTIFTEHERRRVLPASGGFLGIEPATVALLTCKRAEDGRGHIVRLWNPARKAVAATVRAGFVQVARAVMTNLVEEDTAVTLPCEDGRIRFEIGARSVATVRIIESSGS